MDLHLSDVSTQWGNIFKRMYTVNVILENKGHPFLGKEFCLNLLVNFQSSLQSDSFAFQTVPCSKLSCCLRSLYLSIFFFRDRQKYLDCRRRMNTWVLAGVELHHEYFEAGTDGDRCGDRSGDRRIASWRRGESGHRFVAPPPGGRNVAVTARRQEQIH